jgi:hypothetical protein
MGHPLREKNDMDRRLGVNQQDQKIKLILGTMVAVACLMILLRQGGHASLTQRPGTERGLGRRLGAPEGAIGCQISTKYYPSTMEQAWLDNVGTWQSDFCGIISGEQQTAWAKTWLETLQKKQEDSKYRPELDPAVFSRFVTSSNCAGKVRSLGFCRKTRCLLHRHFVMLFQQLHLRWCQKASAYLHCHISLPALRASVPHVALF